jgi:hypothetical protein
MSEPVKSACSVLRSLGLATISLVLLSGCSLLSGPQPWEKGHLAKPEMSMGGDALEQRYQGHIYTSKEAASGGYGVGGGGCGCN